MKGRRRKHAGRTSAYPTFVTETCTCLRCAGDASDLWHRTRESTPTNRTNRAQIVTWGYVTHGLCGVGADNFHYRTVSHKPRDQRILLRRRVSGLPPKMTSSGGYVAIGSAFRSPSKSFAKCTESITPQCFTSFSSLRGTGATPEVGQDRTRTVPDFAVLRRTVGTPAIVIRDAARFSWAPIHTEIRRSSA